jgi:hypothetical protein
MRIKVLGKGLCKRLNELWFLNIGAFTRRSRTFAAYLELKSIIEHMIKIPTCDDHFSSISLASSLEAFF